MNGYGFRILKNMDYGMDMDLVSNPFGPLRMTPKIARICFIPFFGSIICEQWWG